MCVLIRMRVYKLEVIILSMYARYKERSTLQLNRLHKVHMLQNMLIVDNWMTFVPVIFICYTRIQRTVVGVWNYQNLSDGVLFSFYFIIGNYRCISGAMGRQTRNGSAIPILSFMNIYLKFKNKNINDTNIALFL